MTKVEAVTSGLTRHQGWCEDCKEEFDTARQAINHTRHTGHKTAFEWFKRTEYSTQQEGGKS